MTEDSGRWPSRAANQRRPSGVEEALRQSQEQFQSVVGAVSEYAIFLLDPGGFVTSWNAGAERIKGYQAHEIVGRHFSVFYPPESIASNYPATELRVAVEQGRFEDEGWRLRRDGSRFWANVVITALRTASGELRGFLKITRDLTRRREHEEELRVARVELEARVAERTAELERVVDQLREQDRNKNHFLAVLGHELRNPLAPIRSGIELLRDKSPGSDQLSRVVSILDRQTAHLTRLLDDLLDMARITRRSITLDRRVIDLFQAAHDAADAIRPLAESRGQQLELQIPNDPVLVTGDAARLTQVLGNLLHNASKFTPRAGRLSLQISREADEIVATVTDSGVGLEPDEMPRLFEMFAQIERPGATETGLGLGLSLAHHLVELHEGTLRAWSPGRDKGSSFQVRLPAESVAEAAPGERGGPAGVRRRVLIVDDNVDAVETMGLFLSQVGHDVRSSFDGEGALETAGDFKPDVVLLDIGMPGLSGYEIAGRLRAMPFGDQLVLIALTGWGQPGDRERAQGAGFDYHLTKPADPTTIQQIVSGGRPKEFTAIGTRR